MTQAADQSAHMQGESPDKYTPSKLKISIEDTLYNIVYDDVKTLFIWPVRDLVESKATTSYEQHLSFLQLRHPVSKPIKFLSCHGFPLAEIQSSIGKEELIGHLPRLHLINYGRQRLH